ncbi:chromosome segregation in meiosis- protein [Pseudogymnoascus verrucosus]|uniref:Chromosome segregation in meiosis protein n=1 Tax=Pseudogymnoascus verrucosus TaxID=342668 RepID=A0A1B8GI24_9PEZI|nr:chromosome segregation in meiosis- protein [Pseudogymnoascus verrucosus]OBT95491.1 chromosome segregation in meiosis- protein [Pseudogymnoascus verrucosus]
MPPPAETDDLDALFNDYTSVFDRPLSPPPQLPSSPPRTTNNALGLDAPLTLPTHAPRPKLDESRILSSRGIPKLRERARTLRLKGRGHEYGDADRLLGLYQTWLDELYPKAKFGDALRMVESAGHKRDVAVARRGWIEEGRPGREGEGEGDGEVRPQAQEQRQGTERIAPIFTDLASRAAERRETPGADVPDDDPDAIAELYGASPRRGAAAAKPATQGQTSIFGPGAAVVPLPGAAGEEEEDEDDLAALLAEGGMDVDTVTATAAPTNKTKAPEEDEFDDDMDAMAEMGW